MNVENWKRQGAQSFGVRRSQSPLSTSVAGQINAEPARSSQSERINFTALALRICTTIALTFLLGIAGCKRQTNAPEGTPTPKSEFGKALSAPTPPAEIWKEFSGENAFAHTKALVDLGPHPSGSDAIEKARLYIEEELKKTGWKTERQGFTEQTPRGSFSFTNIIARFAGAPTAHQEFIVSSHYDTKLFSTIMFVGANDGCSSTGALIELARVLAMDPDLAWRAELVFFDGEEAVQQFTDSDGLYGSRYYAKRLEETNRAKQFKFGILWDMIGDKEFSITLPPDSPPQLAQGFFNAADALGIRDQFAYFRSSILDDHVPLNRIGIPSIDIIDFDYPYWHTADDTLDKISPESMQKAGAATLWVLRRGYPR